MQQIFYINNLSSIIKNEMGNKCLTKTDRRPAREALDQLKQNNESSPLTFKIRSWPKHKFINLTETSHCIQSSIGVRLKSMEKVNLMLQSRPHKTSTDNGNYDYSLQCQIQDKVKYIAIHFPIKQEKNHVWKFIRGWTDFNQQDVMRMGRTKYKLCKLVQDNKENNASEIKSVAAVSAISVADGEQVKKCRICLSKTQTAEDPLIAPCKCTGSVRFTHLFCLSKWLFSLNVNDNQCINVRKNTSICQICKTDITGTPEYQKMSDMLFSNLQDIPTPYAVLQNTQFKFQEQSNSYFVLCFKNKDTYTIGRSTKADIVDRNDKCISKINSQIKYTDGRLIVRDCDSMHGTMMKVNGSVKLYKQNLSEDVVYHNMVIKAVYSPVNNE